MWVSRITAHVQTPIVVPSFRPRLTPSAYEVTLLAILAAKSIAVPLSPAFPAPELQYILNHSEALMLLSSAKFAPKAQEVLKTELDVQPALLQLDKFQGGGGHEQVTLEKTGADSAGMMLYTSGTTNRPVGQPPYWPRSLPQSAS